MAVDLTDMHSVTVSVAHTNNLQLLALPGADKATCTATWEYWHGHCSHEATESGNRSNNGRRHRQIVSCQRPI